MTTISKDSGYQTVITTFETSPGACQDLLEALQDAYANLISKHPGFISAALHVNDAQTRIANYSQWVERDDFKAMLRTDEWRQRSREINAMCRGFEPVMYEVIDVF